MAIFWYDEVMLIKVKIFVNAGKQEIIQKSEGVFEIKVKAKPEMGKANTEALKILSEFFKIPEANIKLVKGSKTRNKVFNIKP
jgi:uncharacterized protein (TIGR00251 family)